MISGLTSSVVDIYDISTGVMSTLVVSGLVSRASAGALSVSSWAIFAGGTDFLAGTPTNIYTAVDVFSSACSCMQTIITLTICFRKLVYS